MIQAKLKIEILAGYLVLVSCFVFIICLVHEEREKKSAMERQELHWQGERGLTDRTFIGLLDLTATGELVAGWTREDYAAYRKKRTEVTALLQELKMKQEDTEQRNCIDSVCSLLAEKERQMTAILALLENMPDAGEMIRRKIPAIVWQTTKQPSPAATTPAETPATEKKKSFWGFLKKKEEKSAYARQREKTETDEKKQTAGINRPQPPTLLYSLEKEISDTTRLYEERLSAGIDSLRMQNRKLNGKLNLLIRHFELKEAETFCREIQMQQAVRNRSFRLITGTGIGAFALVILLYIIIHRDVNRRYRYRKELEASNRRNEELSQSRRNILLTVSHDLCAPLSAINGYAELMPEEKDETQRDRYAENILHASRHVIGLANNLLYYYRLESGKEQPDKEVFHPGKLIEDVVLSFRPLADKKGLGLTMEAEGVNTMVEGDRLRLVQILNNLVANAVKFTRAGYMHVGVRYADGWLRFFVRDTGKGISEERQSNIFKAFERLDGGDTPGFGLGLPITARLVSLLGGTIRVESREGYGSTFEVCLPLPEAGRPDKEDRPEEGYARLAGLGTILIDDDRMQADLTRRMLERHSIACDCCHDVKELTERLRNKRYDLLMTDMQMPEADGYGVLALLRNSNLGQSKDIPVLAVTARADVETDRTEESGFAGCLHKPFSMDELLAAVAECTDGRTPQRQESDFTPLLEGENDRKEILDLFVQDTEKALADLWEAVRTKDYGTASALIHKGAPLWETIRIGIPAAQLERLASVSPEKWDEELLAEVRELAAAVEQAVEKAKNLLKEDIQ